MAHIYAKNKDILGIFAQVGAVDPAFEDAVIDAAIAQEMKVETLLDHWQAAANSNTPAYAFGFRVLKNLLTLVPWIPRQNAHLFKRAPSLHTIWNEELARIVDDQTTRWESKTDVDAKGEKVDIILAGRVIVGMTGWYPVNDRAVGLRWHGVISPAHSCGFSQHALDLLDQALPSEISCLYAITREPQSCAYLRRRGFDIVPDLDTARLLSKAAGFDITEKGGWALRKMRH